jgi:ADP-heptose:LPS heptosyltransferase|tara:strand:- start:28 stop:870 length:843 start_codon:yes stop_codon:yes gene_type:complete
MGIGDSIMFIGEAMAARGKTDVTIVPTTDMWDPIWNNIPWIKLRKDIKPGENFVVVDTHPMPGGGQRGLRWYHKAWTPGKVHYNYDYQVKPTTIVFSDQEIDRAFKLAPKRPYICLNPSFKNTTSTDNKDWGWEKWVELNHLMKDFPFERVQIIPYEDYTDVSGKVRANTDNLLENCWHIPTYDARIAFAILSGAKAMVTTEGGFSHAAGALNIPGVVIFGGFTPPEITNYPRHTAIYPDHPLSPCGAIHRHCAHCREVMDSIMPEDILIALKSRLDFFE